jgi:hypothetical protein
MSTVAVVDCPPDGNFGDDLTYQFTVKNVGTYAENNVPVDLVIAPRLVATYIDDDFETSDPIGDYLMLTRSTLIQIQMIYGIGIQLVSRQHLEQVH